MTLGEYLWSRRTEIINLAKQIGSIEAASKYIGHYAIIFFLLPSILSGTPAQQLQAGVMGGQVAIQELLKWGVGRASELFKIEDANPNLSFDVAQIPQVKSATNKRTFGEIYAIAINKRSTNLASAIGVAESIVLGDDAKNLSTSLSLPPASRILLSTKPQDPYLYTFFSSAIISKAWLDPDKIKSNKIFGELIENKLSNSMSTGDAINKAQSQLDLLLK